MDLYLFCFQSRHCIFLADAFAVAWAPATLIPDPEYLKRIDKKRDSVFIVGPDPNADLLISYIREFVPSSIVIFLYSENRESVPKNYPVHPHEWTAELWNRVGVDYWLFETELDVHNIGRIRVAVEYQLHLRAAQAKLQQLEKNLSEWENLFQESLDIMFIIDASSKRIVEANHTASILLGYNREELIGKDFSLLAEPIQRPNEDEDEAEFHGSAIINQGLVSAEGKWIPMESTWRLFHRDGIAHIVATFRDISERKEAEERIYHLAYYSSIGNIPNKFYLEEQIRQELQDPKSRSEQFALIILDIDNFKLINDSMGSEIGDELLRKVGTRLKEFPIKKTFVAHLGSDEFALLVKNLKSLGNFEETVAQLNAHLKTNYVIQGKEYFVSFSMGVALFPQHGETVPQLHKSADIAMYSAKAKGKNTFALYNDWMTNRVRARMEVENDLRKAIQFGQFRVFFQPQVSLATGELCGMEALIRWLHPEKGMIMPGSFIGVAEDSGLIHEIGMTVLLEACRFTKQWHDRGMIHYPVSVNLSAKQWNNPRIASEIFYILKSSGLPHNLLIIELTESCIMDNPDRSRNLFSELVEGGVGLSVDDFGTGYSSLSYLQRLDVDHLKIDKSFVRDLERSEDDRSISKAIIDLAHSLGLQVVAEGVENPNQYRLLHSMGCDMIQGYLVSPPLPEKEFEVLLQNFRRLEYGVTKTIS